jgi:hypothetical protein
MSTTGKIVPDSPVEAGGVAAQMAALLDQIEALVPGYTKPDSARARTVTSNARFAQELITPTIAAVSNYEPLRQHNLFDVDHARGALKLRDELRPVQQRVAAIAAAIEFTVDSELADAGIEALQVYRWSQHHIRHHEGEGLRPYVDEMKQVVKKAIGRRTKAKAKPGAPQGFMADLIEKAHEIEEEKKATV